MKRVSALCLLGALTLMALLSCRQAGAATPLSIELTVPSTCEADFDDGEVTPTLNVEWRIAGGTPPYRVAVGNTLSEDAGGVANEICGIWSHDEVQSGVMTVQARVADANGEVAAAVTHVYAVRVVRSNAFYGLSGRLMAGHTYRVHDLLMTIPAEFDMLVSERRCRPNDAACKDAFELAAMNNGAVMGNGTEVRFSRASRSETQRRIAPHFAYDEADLDEAIDGLVESIGRPPPASILPLGVAAAETSNLSFRLISPVICDQQDDSRKAATVPVAWTVTGGAAPRRVIIHGREFAGSSGSTDVPCGALVGRHADSGLQVVHGTAIDDDGHVASDTAYIYSIAHPRGQEATGDLTTGETYRIEGHLFTIPDGLTIVDAGIFASSSGCDPPSKYCVGGGPFTVVIQGAQTWQGRQRAQVDYDLATGNELSRRISDLSGAWTTGSDVGRPSRFSKFDTTIDLLSASVGRPPELPPDHHDQLAPLTITGYADPPSCVTGAATTRISNVVIDGVLFGAVTGGAVNLYLTVSGGFWAPIAVQADGLDLDDPDLVQGSGYTSRDLLWKVDDRLFRKDCRGEPGSATVSLHAQDRSDPPQEAVGTVSFSVFPMIGGSDRLALTASAKPSAICEPGARVIIDWHVQTDSTTTIVAVQGVHGLRSKRGAAWVECQETPGMQIVWVMAADRSDPERTAAVPVMLNVVNDPPIPNTLFAFAGPMHYSCEPGVEIEIIWSAIGGLPPHTVQARRPADTTSTSANSFKAVCPRLGWIGIDVGDSSALPRTITHYSGCSS